MACALASRSGVAFLCLAGVGDRVFLRRAGLGLGLLRLRLGLLLVRRGGVAEGDRLEPRRRLRRSLDLSLDLDRECLSRLSLQQAHGRCYGTQHGMSAINIHRHELVKLRQNTVSYQRSAIFDGPCPCGGLGCAIGCP